MGVDKKKKKRGLVPCIVNDTSQRYRRGHVDMVAGKATHK